MIARAKVGGEKVLQTVSLAQQGAKAVQLGTDVVVAQGSEFVGQICGNEVPKVFGVRH